MTTIQGALLALALAAGFFISDMRDQGAIERLRGKVETARRECETDKVTALQAAVDWLQAENERLEGQAARERSRARALRLQLRDMAAAAAKTREELNHALAETDLRKCDARRPARLLRDKAEHYRRQLAGSGADARGADGGTGTGAGDAPQRP